MIRSVLLSAVFCAFAFSAMAETAPRVVGTRTMQEHASTVIATIETVSRTTREILVRDADGNYTTYRLPARVRNFNQIKPGDVVQIDVTDTVVLSLVRGGSPTAAAEHTHIRRAPHGARPGFSMRNVSQITSQVDSVNRDARQVVLRSADGKLHTVRAPDDVNLDNVQPGDTVVATLIEAAVLAIRPAPTGR